MIKWFVLYFKFIFLEVQDGAVDDTRVIGTPAPAPLGLGLGLRQPPTRLSTNAPYPRPLVPLARLQLILRRCRRGSFPEFGLFPRKVGGEPGDIIGGTGVLGGHAALRRRAASRVFAAREDQ